MGEGSIWSGNEFQKEQVTTEQTPSIHNEVAVGTKTSTESVPVHAFTHFTGLYIAFPDQ
jgi:hypothetical protein